MTDGEPEPFRMATEPDAVDDDAVDATEGSDAPDDDAPDDDAPDVSSAGDESVAELIAAASAAAEVQGWDEEPTDGADDEGAAIWGTSTRDDSRAVWDDAAGAADGNVWDLEDEEGSTVWDGVAAAHVPAAEDPAAEPAPGPPAAGTDHVEDDEDEPELFTFGAEPATQPSPATTPDVTGPAAATGATDDEDDDEVWTFPVGTTNDTTLAETATPRDDTGWHDLDAAEQPRWDVTEAQARRHDAAGTEDEPEGFVAMVGSTDAGQGDGGRDDAGQDDVRGQPAHALAAEAQDVLEELLGQDDEPAPAAAIPTRTSDGLDHLDELDDFDHLEETGAAAASSPDPDPARDDGDDAEETTYEQPLDAPTAARQVMEPGQVAFSSGGRKRRGLFG